jgi:addiction module HigA family antidote
MFTLFPHPGTIVHEEFFQDNGHTPESVAQRTGLRLAELREIFAGRSPIDARVAHAFGEFFHCDPQFFLNMQATYDRKETEARLRSAAHKRIPRIAQTIARPVRHRHQPVVA